MSQGTLDCTASAPRPRTEAGSGLLAPPHSPRPSHHPASTPSWRWPSPRPGPTSWSPRPSSGQAPKSPSPRAGAMATGPPGLSLQPLASSRLRRRRVRPAALGSPSQRWRCRLPLLDDDVVLPLQPRQVATGFLRRGFVTPKFLFGFFKRFYLN